MKRKASWAGNRRGPPLTARLELDSGQNASIPL